MYFIKHFELPKKQAKFQYFCYGGLDIKNTINESLVRYVQIKTSKTAFPAFYMK